LIFKDILPRPSEFQLLGSPDYGFGVWLPCKRHAAELAGHRHTAIDEELELEN
jgi:hypothetical protein